MVSRGVRVGPLISVLRVGAYWVAASIGLLAAVGTVTYVIVLLMNAEYRSRAHEFVTIKGSGGGGAQTVLRFDIGPFNESTGRVAVTAAVVTRDDRLVRLLEQDSIHMFLVVTDGVQSGDTPPLASTQLRFRHSSIPNAVFGAAASDPVTFSALAATDVSVFPFDAVQVRLLPFLTTREEFTPPHSIEVTKSYVGRTLTVTGNTGEVVIRARRTVLDRMVVVGAAVLFLALCTVVGGHLWSGKATLSPLDEAVAFAGFLLATLGVREFAGFSALPSRSFLDVILFIPTLGALLIIFVLRRRGAAHVRHSDH